MHKHIEVLFKRVTIGKQNAISNNILRFMATET